MRIFESCCGLRLPACGRGGHKKAKVSINTWSTAILHSRFKSLKDIFYKSISGFSHEEFHLDCVWLEWLIIWVPIKLKKLAVSRHAMHGQNVLLYIIWGRILWCSLDAENWMFNNSKVRPPACSFTRFCSYLKLCSYLLYTAYRLNPTVCNTLYLNFIEREHLFRFKGLPSSSKRYSKDASSIIAKAVPFDWAIGWTYSSKMLKALS